VGSVSLASPFGGYICSVSLFNAHYLRDKANELMLGIPKHILSAEQVVFRNIQSMGSGINMFDEYKKGSERLRLHANNFCRCTTASLPEGRSKNEHSG